MTSLWLSINQFNYHASPPLKTLCLKQQKKSYRLMSTKNWVETCWMFLDRARLLSHYPDKPLSRTMHIRMIALPYFFFNGRRRLRKIDLLQIYLKYDPIVDVKLLFLLSC